MSHTTFKYRYYHEPEIIPYVEY